MTDRRDDRAEFVREYRDALVFCLLMAIIALYEKFCPPHTFFVNLSSSNTHGARFPTRILPTLKGAEQAGVAGLFVARQAVQINDLEAALVAILYPRLARDQDLFSIGRKTGELAISKLGTLRARRQYLGTPALGGLF